MANVYDQETGKPLDKKPAGDPSLPAGDWGSDPIPSAEDIENQERDAGSSPSGGQRQGSSKSESSSKLGSAEQKQDSGLDQGIGASNSLYNEKGDEGRGGIRGAFGKGAQARNKAQNTFARMARNKWFIGGIISSTWIIALVVILLLLVAGSNKLVSFAEHMASYQFARTTRQMAQNTNKITAEKMGIQLMTDDEHSRARVVYAQATGKVSNLWGNLDKYRPNKAISNMQGAKYLQFNTEPTRLGFERLTSVTIDGKTTPIERSRIKNLVPGYKFKGNIDFSRDFAPNLNQGLKSADIGVITRAKIAREIRKKLGISLTAWTVGKYTGKSEAEARSILNREVDEKVRGTNAKPVTTSNRVIQDASDEAEKARQEAIKSDENLRNPERVQQAVNEAVERKITTGAMDQAFGSLRGALSAAVNFVNPLYAVAAPMCMIYEGSVAKAGPAIEKNTAEQQRKGVLMLSAGAQQKDGLKASPEAVGAYNWKAGDTMTSNVELRASGQRIDTTNYQSVQGSATGSTSTSIIDLLPNKPLADFMDGQAETFCPVFTDIWVGVALGGVNIAAIVLSGGSAAAPEAAAQAAAQTGMRAAVSKITAKLVASKSAGAQFAKDTAKTGAAVFGATLIARQIVEANTGASHDSLQVGKQFLDDADSGANIYGNQMAQQALYGAPLSDSELNADYRANKLQMAMVEAQKSGFERYLDVDNPNSLLTRTAMSTSSFFGQNTFKTLLDTMGSILNPMMAFGNTLDTALTGTSFADEPITSVNTYYGNVQFGYTEQENSIIRNDLSYRPMKNQEILDNSGLEDEISTIYASCFDGSKGISDLLTTKGKNQDGNDQHWIVRDGGGDVVGGICSQANVGPVNAKYDNLVFRWRVAKSYDNTIEQLIDQQNIRSNNAPSAIEGDTPSGTVLGDAQGVANQLIEQGNKGKIVFNVLNGADRRDDSTPEANLRDTAAGQKAKTTSSCAGRGATAPNRSVELDANLLKFILDLSDEVGNLEVNSLAGQCHSGTGSNHYKGKAVDFDCPFNKAAADRVGKKYGVSTATGETCAEHAHYHYSIGGY